MSSASPKASKFLIIQHTLSPQKEKERKRKPQQPMSPKKKMAQTLTTKGRRVSVLLKKQKTEAHFTN
jgi:hypothetical protein